MSKTTKWILAGAALLVAYFWFVRPKISATGSVPAAQGGRSWWQTILSNPNVGNAVGSGFGRVVNLIGRQYGPSVPAEPGRDYEIVAGAQYANEYGAGD